MVIVAFGQKKKALRHADFQDQKISHSWIIVKYRPGAEPLADLKSRAFDVSKRETSPTSALDGMMRIKVNKGENPIDLCNRLLKNPDVLYAEPIIHDRPLYVPSDQLIASQYYLDNIQAYDAWDISKGDDDITIAIIDTGFDLDHEDLISNLWINEDDPIDGIDNDENGYIDDYRGYDFADDDNDPEADQNTHGIRVGGVAGASTDNGLGMAGVGFNTKIAALKGFRSSDGLSTGLFDAVLYAADNGMQIMNLSWGSIRQPLQSEQDIINYAVLEKDVVVVAAAGNDGNKTTAEEKFYPASYENILSVAGSDASDSKWSGSSYNYSVDITAPAAGILSTSGNNSYNSSSGFGTSFAAPMVAAAAALVKDQFPSLTARQIMERVRVTADDIYDVGSNNLYEGKLGKGRLNVYRALSENNLRSMRAESPTLTSSFGEYVFFGDTVRVTASLTNFLSNVSDPAIYISSLNSEFSISQGSFFPGPMGTMDSQEISFEIILSEELEPETTVGIRLDYQEGAYNDFQFIDVKTSPDHVDFGNETISMSISGNGNLGLVTYGADEEGSGLIYQSDTLLKYTGILLAPDETNVANNFISDYSNFIRGNDFVNQTYYKLIHHPAADHFGYSEFTDAINNLIIEQSNITWENEEYLVIRYRIINNNPEAVENLSFGVFSDWNLSDPDQNYAEYNTTSDYLFVRNNESDLYAATKVLGSGTINYSALDLKALNGNTQDIGDEFTDSEKYDYLVNQSIPTAGASGSGNDVAGIHGITIPSIDAYGESFINVIYTASDSQANLESTLNDAEDKLDEFLQIPRLQETFYTCDGFEVTIDPSNGDQYEFYEDPLGTSLLSTGTAFSPGTITQDTSFYAKNTDGIYPSDIFELRLLLFNEIADFSMSTDTLYLDNATNIVQFTDQSQDAVSWHWDFGEGTMASSQNPSISFNNPANYTISLTVENAQGCSDTISKTLVVSDRPEALSFDDYTVCPGGILTLSNASAEKLKAFSSPNQQTPEVSGVNIEVGPFNTDSTIYISAIIGGFETTKVPVNITVYDIQDDFFVMPDTLSETHQLRIIANTESTSTINWSVNGEDRGVESEILIDAVEGIYSILLDVLSEEGCSVQAQRDIVISTSPAASATDLVGCQGDSVILKPENGSYFGFYEDAELTSFISKGTQLTIKETSQVFVVNLDDGLPGTTTEVNISLESFDVTVDYTASQVGTKHQVVLSAISEDVIQSFQWYLNGELTETTESPIFFIDPTTAEIVLEATNEIGCTAKDTLQLDFTPPLGITDDGRISIHPNPTDGLVQINSELDIQSITILDLSGKQISSPKLKNDTIQLDKLQPGVYIVRFEVLNEMLDLKVIVE